MSVSQSDRESVITSLCLRPELVQLLLDEMDCGAFADYFGKPVYFYSRGYPENPGFWPELSGRSLLPLWEHSEKIYALDVEKENEGISFYIENPREFETFGSIDQAIFEIVELHVWEYGGSELEATEALDFAKNVALPNIAGLEELLSNHTACTEELIASYRSSL